MKKQPMQQTLVVQHENTIFSFQALPIVEGFDDTMNIPSLSRKIYVTFFFLQINIVVNNIVFP
jgi:hypothetical protein